MKKLSVILSFGIFVLLVSFRTKQPELFKVPKGWPDPSYNFKKTPLNEQQIELGRTLFYDPILSKDSTISCSSCHLQYTAFTHIDHSLSHGIEGKIGTRNSPALVNLAWSKTLMWDGAITHINEQARAPITNALEMDERMEHVVEKLQASARYPSVFYDAFGDSVIKAELVLKAIGQYMLTLVSADAKYDSVKRGDAQFTEVENRGYAIFRKSCSSCHAEPLFTNGGFENNGLIVDGDLKDIGRMKVTKDPLDSLKFKVPTLRNIQYSYPYMHDGRFKNLNQVLNSYAMGVQQSTTLNPKLAKGIYLTAEQKGDLIAFLFTLTDKSFLHNPKFAYPTK